MQDAPQLFASGDAHNRPTTAAQDRACKLHPDRTVGADICITSRPRTDGKGRQARSSRSSMARMMSRACAPNSGCARALAMVQEMNPSLEPQS